MVVVVAGVARRLRIIDIPTASEVLNGLHASLKTWPIPSVECRLTLHWILF